MFEVSEAAESTALTTLEAVKSALSITGSGEDDYLSTLIEQASALVCGFLKVQAAEDGSRTLGRETLVETFRLDRCWRELPLSRTPVSSITSVVEDGETLSASDYEIKKAAGLLVRLDGSDGRSVWPGCKIIVTYVAGWVLPGDGDDRNLPHDIESAIFDLVRGARSARFRDPNVKSEDVSGVLATTYWVGGVGDNGAIPPDVQSKLLPYRNLVAL